LRQDSRFDVMAVPPAPDQFAGLVSGFIPHVTVVGVSAARSAGRSFALLRQGLARDPRVKPVLLLDYSTADLVVRAFREGARGVICRGDGIAALRKCIYVVHHGQVWANSTQLGYLLDAFSRR
jgi:DNA-binding NarL/FixJ family response regulator